MKLKLTRPLVFFDLETTGINIGTDRIVEISYYKVFPNGNAEGKTLRVNPGMPIPAEATAVHGITDEDVRDCPRFEQIAPEIAAVIEDSDLAGYNSNFFDVPLLAEEMLRAKVNIDLKQKKLVDAFAIFKKQEPRNLTAAYKFYCGKNLDDAHSAQADTMATYEVLMAQLERYEDVPDTVEALDEYTRGQVQFADFAGRIAYDAQGEEVFNFGKHKGLRVKDVFRRDPSYYAWLMNTDFPAYTKQVFTRIYAS
ncbi:MAG: 3'-5' exonuclease [Paludibacteraceae bacterium]|nr:3'-5' exonuclease [Paludibacteraceae bacterium]